MWTSRLPILIEQVKEGVWAYGWEREDPERVQRTDISQTGASAKK